MLTLTFFFLFNRFSLFHETGKRWNLGNKEKQSMINILLGFLRKNLSMKTNRYVWTVSSFLLRTGIFVITKILVSVVLSKITMYQLCICISQYNYFISCSIYERLHIYTLLRFKWDFYICKVFLHIDKT